MVLVAALGRHVQHISRVGHFPLHPIGDILAESAADLGIESNDIVLAKGFQAGAGPVAHRHHYGFLVHLEFSGFSEMQAAFPGIPEPIGPFAGVAISLMPDVFFGP